MIMRHCYVLWYIKPESMTVKKGPTSFWVFRTVIDTVTHPESVIPSVAPVLSLSKEGISPSITQRLNDEILHFVQNDRISHSCSGEERNRV